MKTLRPFALTLCAIFAFSTARATTVIPPTFDELVTKAELIFEGTVTDVKSQWVGEGAQRHIVSYVTVQVADSVKGNPGESYTLRMLGGTVGEDTMEVSDSPKFHVGDRDILFVENNGTQFIPLVGIMHGRFHVERDSATGADTVLTNGGKTVSDLQTLGREDAPASSKSATTNAVERPIDAESFKAAIRSKLGVQ
jgi:hypothetical protein